MLIHVVDVSGSEGRDPIDDFEKINEELRKYSDKLAQKPQVVCANKIDLIETDSPEYLAFKEHVESKGVKVFPVSAPLRIGITELLAETVKMLAKAEAELVDEPVETFDFELDDQDPNYRDVNVKKVDDVYILEGKQLEKIFNSTNFNDMGSLRYLYKYIERSGAVEKMKELGLEEGDSIRIQNFEFEYYDEY